ncbi:unnamed protein product [Adineta steineri]|uniref:Uncharacterized protein n=1 Tax=Adineta steineri TaxID=433720 RepID=A0A813TG14_9BILA|nr:unnamed protein product [Adineta steineri]CAF0928587.1 unnamed protein product [Adineta steineri]
MVNTNHFQGGTITYKIVNTYESNVSIMITQIYLYKWPLIYCDNSYILSQSTPNMTDFSEYNYTLNCVANCTTAGGYKPVLIRTYCTDYSSAMAISVTARTDIVNLTLGAYFIVAFRSTAWRPLSLPKRDISDKVWSVSCTINLSIRFDTGKLNTPPVTNMISPIYIPVGVRTSLIIPTIDSDNDVVRCRFATTVDECADACPSNSLPNDTVIVSSNCTLFITGIKADDWYAVAIQIEDFADLNSTTPLSSVPVQFLINVYASPKCLVAPILDGSSNQTGIYESVQVGQLHSMTLYAINYCTLYSVTIKDIATLSFPIVIKSNITQISSLLYSVTLTWTPTESQVGSQILCAVAIDSQNVQSNQYCTAFIVNMNSTAVYPGELSEMTEYSTSTTILTTTDITTTTGSTITPVSENTTTTSAAVTINTTTNNRQNNYAITYTTILITETTFNSIPFTAANTESMIDIDKITTDTTQTTMFVTESTPSIIPFTIVTTESTSSINQITMVPAHNTIIITESTMTTTDTTLMTTENIYVNVQSTSITTVNNNLVLTSSTPTLNMMLPSTDIQISSTSTQEISDHFTSSVDNTTTLFSARKSTTDTSSKMNTTIYTTTPLPLNEWILLLPLIVALAILLVLVCCLCLCCSPPYGLGLLFPRHNRVRSEPILINSYIYRTPTMYIISKTLEKDLVFTNRNNMKSSVRLKSIIKSDIYLDASSSIAGK